MQSMGVESARQVFDKIEVIDAVLWNSMLAVYSLFIILSNSLGQRWPALYQRGIKRSVLNGCPEGV
jgi:hypothetical protein